MTYLLSIIGLLVVPACLLGAVVRRRVRWPALAAAIPVISLVGAIWSMVVTANAWWSFGDPYVTGVRIVKYLLVEEVVFYPAGGALCIMLYLAGGHLPATRSRHRYLTFLSLGTLLLGILALWHAHNRPSYLYSQLLVYNLLVCGGLAPAVSHRIDLTGLALSTSVMAVLGFAWDHVALTGGWWQYHAVTGVRLGEVPIDNLAFFLYAPAAAISVYELAALLVARRSGVFENRALGQAFMGLDQIARQDARATIANRGPVQTRAAAASDAS